MSRSARRRGDREPVVQVHGVTHPGHVRGKNEDCFLADTSRLYRC